MAEARTDDELDRGATADTASSSGGRGRGAVPLADEGRDELPALLAIAVGIAILVIGLIWSTIGDDATDGLAGSDEAAAVAEEEPAEIAEPEDEPAEDQPEIAAPAADAAVTATAAQVSIVLDGTVPDEATRDAIVSRAVAVYADAQVDDRLVVDDSVTPPVSVTLTGSMTDPVLHGQVEAAFADLDGVELADTSGFTLEESSDLEAALNGLEPIQFAFGSALVGDESAPILDEAAELLIANPDVALEVGGHTDSLGGEEANQTLSEARAQAVLDGLVARGVENDLSAVGFGERRLKVSPDEDDPAAQQENRRIEFRTL